MEKINSLSVLALAFLLILSITNASAAAASKKCKPPSAIYAFGDATLDAGNNNKLLTLCRANHKPYGVDFPGQSATGRFSNGMLPGDILVSDLGIKDLLPAYSEAEVGPDELMTGATFASSCSGFHDLTANEASVLTLDKQFQNFQKAFQSMAEKFGLPNATAAVENALFLISAGSTDMMDNYYVLPTTKLKYNLPAYHDFLLKNLETFVKKLYNAGAKKLGVIGMPPLGCLPIDVTTNVPFPPSPSQSQTNADVKDDFLKRECRSQHNSDAQEYNTKLQARVKKMMVAMPQLKIAYMDIYSPMMDMINKPDQFGFKTTHEGCCGTGALEVGPACNLFSFTCQDPAEYVFWDSAHPTEATYKDLTKIFLDKVLPALLN